ncbi:MAG: dihydroorotate dehydrogenase electron transfer subunit [Chitinispirillaceae bacterium]|nr:dihydroorotate dehydrogenase electron transfer subunit [Chitinispirillaceae bacterium]
MKQFSSTIVSNRPISTDFYEIGFSWDRAVVSPHPGQFFTVRISETTVPLLRRPFAFSGYAADSGRAAMIYQKRGRGTEIMAAKKPGDTLDLLGPLGTAFPLSDKEASVLLVAGGIGLGPIMFLATALTANGQSVRCIFGSRNAGLVPDLAPFHAHSPVICTDDGSAGFKGTTVDYIMSIEQTVTRATVIYACGPMPMLKACHTLALRKKCACFVSVEQVMACGVGACMGCAVKTAAGGYARACHEGPVFNSNDLQW